MYRQCSDVFRQSASCLDNVKMMCKITFFGHVMLVLASCDTDGIINDTITFTRSRQLEQGGILHFWSCDANIGIM